jgi:hypothetical protein
MDNDRTKQSLKAARRALKHGDFEASKCFWLERARNKNKKGGRSALAVADWVGSIQADAQSSQAGAEAW